MLTQAPAYTLVTGAATFDCFSNPPTITDTTAAGGFDWNQVQSFAGKSGCSRETGQVGSIYEKLYGQAVTLPAYFVTYLLSPSRLGGSATHLASVQFCYGTGTGTAGSGQNAQTASFTITGAQAYEMDEPRVPSTASGAPPYSHQLLFSTPLNLTNGSDCATVSPSKPAAIDPSGYLMFQLLVTFSASAGYYDPSQNYTLAAEATAPFNLGRVTATYSP